MRQSCVLLLFLFYCIVPFLSALSWPSGRSLWQLFPGSSTGPNLGGEKRSKSSTRIPVSLSHEPSQNTLTKFEGCPARPAVSPLLNTLSGTDATATASEKVGSQHRDDKHPRAVAALQGLKSSVSCAANEIPLSDTVFGSAPSISCCPGGHLECAGCAVFTSASNTCSKCLPGFVKQCTGKGTGAGCKPVCTACTDIPGFADTNGKTCADVCPATPKLFSTAEINAFTSSASSGTSAIDACCACGGGLRAPTPWAYNDDIDFVMGRAVKIIPVPRTATHFAPDGCELEKFGLALDPSTGVIDGTPTVQEPFSLQCKVTAVQSTELGLAYNATMSIRVMPLAYGRANILLGPQPLPVVSSYTYLPNRFGVTCSPKTKWIDMAAMKATGELKLLPGGLPDGGLAGTAIETTASEHLKGLNATLTGTLLTEKPSTKCHVTAVRQQTNSPGGQVTEFTDTADLVVIKSEPWTDIVYPTTFSTQAPLLLTVGKPVDAPVALRPTDTGGKGGSMPPAFFTVACAKRGTTQIVTEHVARTAEVFFVTTPGLRVPLFSMDPTTGEISGATASKREGAGALPFVYNAAAQRGLLELECKVFGSILTDSKPSGPAGPLPVSTWLQSSTAMAVTVQDDSCWQEVQLGKSQAVLTAYTQVSAHTSLEACRKQCESDPSCALFTFATSPTNECRKARYSSKNAVPATGSALLDFHAKLKSCDPSLTCRALEVTGHAWLGGTFCPLIRDLQGGVSGGYAFQKSGFTPEDAAVLYAYVPDREGATPPCPAGTKWIIRQSSPTDYVDTKFLAFTFRGRLLACLPPESPRGTYAATAASVFMPPDFTKKAATWVMTNSPRTCNSPLENLADKFAAEGQAEAKGQSTAAEEENTGEGASPGSSSVPEVYRIHDPDIVSPPGAASHWLDPCECFPAEWGPNPPVSPQVFAKLPQNARSVPLIPKLTAAPQLIVKGAVTCMWKDLQSASATESVEACSALCRAAADCNFFWVGTVGATPQCRLYSACEALMSEPGNEQDIVSGALYGLPRHDACLIADPVACAAQTKRRKFLTSSNVEAVSEPKYKTICQRMTRDAAANACRAEGMSLAQVNNQVEADWIYAAMFFLANCHIGIGWLRPTRQAKTSGRTATGPPRRISGGARRSPNRAPGRIARCSETAEAGRV